MSFAKTATAAPRFVPKFNVGCLLDIMTGYPVRGLNNETITLGGLHHFTGGTGEANSAKTGMAEYQVLTVLERYKGTSLTVLDTESTLPVERMIARSRRFAPSRVVEFVDKNGVTQYVLDNVTITNHSKYKGEAFFAEFKKYGQNRPKLKADYVLTPFVDPETDERIKILIPDIVFVDSFSQLNTSAAENMQNATDAGDSKQNMLWMVDGRVKAQILTELPIISEQYGLYYYMTAQIGENKNLDPYAPQRSTLGYLKNNLKLKRVPDEYRYNAHNLWFNFKMKTMNNPKTKAPEYPRNASENSEKGSQDLQEIVVINLRGKSGASGEPVSILYSQSQGILPSLSEFHYCKTNKFGLVGNDQNYALALMPDVKLNRSVVRSKLDESAKLRTAMSLTSDLLQVTMEWHGTLPYGFICDAVTLYDDIIAKGYEWDVLLESRNYWTFDQYENPVPFLSAMDLLYMREGTYVPYWLTEKDGKYVPQIPKG